MEHFVTGDFHDAIIEVQTDNNNDDSGEEYEFLELEQTDPEQTDAEQTTEEDNASSASENSNPKRFRRSFTIKRKLEILSEYQPGINGHGFAAVAKRYAIDSKTLRSWFQKRNELASRVGTKDNRINESRRLPGGGRKHFFAEIDGPLLEWVRARNAEGLRVSYKYLRAKAKEFAVSSGITNFKSSTGYIKRFCNRNKLGSRRQTTTRHLPDDADSLAMNFINGVREFIKAKNIKLCNVLNMDQVPRTFESEPKSTITEKGVHQVLMRKAGSSHKKFTVTFTVSGKNNIIPC